MLRTNGGPVVNMIFGEPVAFIPNERYNNDDRRSEERRVGKEC